MPGETSAARELVVDTVEIRRHTGTRRPFVVAATVDDLEAGEFAVVDGRLDLDLVVEAVAEGVVVSGVAAGRWTGPCRRCLEPIVAPLSVEVREVFESRPTEGETWPIDDERIDLVPMLREAALLALPLVPLCADGCPGPDPDRYVTRVAADPPERGRPVRDPRWAVLDDLDLDH